MYQALELTQAQSVIDAINNTQYEIPPLGLMLPVNPLLRPNSDQRPKSVSIEDTYAGDTGKGRVTQYVNGILSVMAPDIGFKFDLYNRKIDFNLVSERFNGAGNTGHEVKYKDIRITCHQLPVACLQERALAICGRGMAIHPVDWVTEKGYIEKTIGSKLPGTVIIDPDAVVLTDIHRAWEKFFQDKLRTGEGSTQSGVYPSQEDIYGKRALTMRDFVADNWERLFKERYLFYDGLLKGSGFDLARTQIKKLNSDGIREDSTVGWVNEYMDKLREARRKIMKHVYGQMFDLRGEIWFKHLEIPISEEGAQGPLLDPRHGIYPDVTATRPIANLGILDSSEGYMSAEDFALSIGNAKGVYSTIVGAKVPPYRLPDAERDMYMEENEEVGKSSGRKRPAYPEDLVAMRHYQQVAKFKNLVLTHIDSAHEDIPVRLIIGYRDARTGKPVGFRPYQWHWDNVEAVEITMPGWNGKEAGRARSPLELPQNALKYIKVMSDLVAPVAFVTVGPNLGETVSFLP